MDERLVGRNRKYHAGWRHFTDFVQGGMAWAAPTRAGGGGGSGSNPLLKPQPADGEEQGRRQRQAAASMAEDEEATEEEGGGAASSVAALLAAAEGKMVISDAVRLQYQERVAALVKVRPCVCGPSF